MALSHHGVRGLRAYDPGHDLPRLRARHGVALIELGSNEAALPPSPAVLDALRVGADSVLRYPDPRGLELRQALATKHRLSVEQIMLGNGSHELLMLIAQAFVNPGEAVAYAEFGFAVFAIAAQAQAATAVKVPARSTHVEQPRGHDLAAFAARARGAKLVYLANPNNPTGTWFDQAELQALLDVLGTSTLVVVDEAYGEFHELAGGASAIALLDRYPQLLVTRSFSKCYGLAGLRCGALFADPRALQVIEPLRESFNVSALAQFAATAALADVAHTERVLSHTALWRDALKVDLRALGLSVADSRTNFLLVDLNRDATATEQALYQHGVIVRPMAGYGLGHCIRVTVGTPEQNRRLLGLLAEVL